MIELGQRLLAANETGVFATLFASRGSTYRPLGSMMVAGPGSLTAGGVSGGCLEEYIARHGRLLVQESQAHMLSFEADPNSDDDDKPKLGCGGSIEVLVERFTTEHLGFLRDFATAHERDVASVAYCHVDGEQDGTIHVRRSKFSAWSGTFEVDPQTLIYRVEPMTRLVIFGAGDDVKPLGEMALSLGWHVTVADRRARRASRARFPHIDQLIAAAWDDAIEEIAFTPRTAVILMTHSLADDIAILPLLREKPMAYVGALGPAHRRQWVIEGASVTASLPEEFVASFRGPIGLNLGERSPAGIALAIVAEVAATMNAHNARPLTKLENSSSTPIQISVHA